MTRDGVFSRVFNTYSFGFPVYQNSYGEHLYYWVDEENELSSWIVGPDHTSDMAGIVSGDNLEPSCPDNYGLFYIYTTEWTIGNTITATCVDSGKHITCSDPSSSKRNDFARSASDVQIRG